MRHEADCNMLAKAPFIRECTCKVGKDIARAYDALRLVQSLFLDLEPVKAANVGGYRELLNDLDNVARGLRMMRAAADNPGRVTP